MVGSDPLGWLGSSVEDRFTVEQIVGEGGFGIVYRGRHLGFDEPVAIKCLKIPTQLSDEQREKFLREFQGEARLLHRLSRKTAGIVQALDVGAAVSPKGIWTPYMVMEWLEGHTLEDEIATRRRKRLPPRGLVESVDLLATAAQALAVAHESGIAHLDVKPANLFITEDEGRLAVKVLDFGIARTFRSSNTLTRAMTAQGTALQAFTPDYAAPEQFHKRHGKPGAHTDVFALGLILIELASGERALDGDTPLQLYIAAANEQMRPNLSAHGVAVSDLLEQALRGSLEVDPKKRYPDAGAMWRGLEDALAEAPESREARGAPVLISVTPPSLGEQPPEAGTAATAFATTMGHNRVCTVLFAELLGTDALSQQLDPEQLRQVIERCLEVVESCVSAAGGTVEELVGDRLMAVFGLHTDSAGAAERAVHAALRMRRALASFSLPHRALRSVRIRMRAGINSGRVYVALATGRTSGRISLTGAPVTLAARLQQAAAPDEILVGRDTYRQVSGIFDGEIATLAKSEGDTSTTLKIYRVRDTARTGLDASRERDFHGIETSFVDRQAEMEALAAVSDALLVQPRARSVTLLGPAGIGRSRLLSEYAQTLAESGVTVIAVSSSSLHTRTSYALAASLLRACFDVHEDDARALAQDKLRRGLEALRSKARSRSRQAEAPPRGPWSGSRRLTTVDDAEVVGQLMWVLGHRAAPASGDELGTNDRTIPIKHRIAGAFAAMLGAAGGPIAVLCDDAQWTDDASFELLDDLLVRMADQPLLVVCATQPGLADRHPAWCQRGPAREVVELGPLSSHHLSRMIRDRLQRVADLPDDLVVRVAEIAEGYPLTLVEILHLLIDAGAIEVSDDAWQLHAERVGTLALPTSILGVVQARLDRLDDWSRALLGKAAVVGRTFWDEVLRDLDTQAGSNPAALTGVLGALCERGILRHAASSMFPGAEEYTFCESATQQVAYDMLGGATKRELHRAVAGWLEARTSPDEGAALVARHYEKAAVLDKAARAYARAAAHAARLGQNAEALHGYERACRLDEWMTGEIDPDSPTAETYIGWDEPQDARITSWPERVRLRVELGDVLRRMGRLDEAEESYDDARDRIVVAERRAASTIDPLEVPRWEARIDHRLALMQEVRGSVDEPRELCERAIGNARRGGLSIEVAQMHVLIAALHLRVGELELSKRACLDGLRVLRSASPRGERWREATSRLLRTLGGTLYMRQRHVPAERCYLQAARLVDGERDPQMMSRVLNNVAATRYGRGEVEGARESFRRALELADRSGDLWMTMTALGNLGEVEIALGRHELARDLLREAVELGERVGARGDVADCYRNLANALRALAEHQSALDAIVRALELAKTGGGRIYLLSVVRTAADVCRAAGSAGIDVTAVARNVLAVLDSEPPESEHREALEECRPEVAALLASA